MSPKGYIIIGAVTLAALAGVRIWQYMNIERPAIQGAKERANVSFFSPWMIRDQGNEMLAAEPLKEPFFVFTKENVPEKAQTIERNMITGEESILPLEVNEGDAQSTEVEQRDHLERIIRVVVGEDALVEDRVMSQDKSIIIFTYRATGDEMTNTLAQIASDGSLFKILRTGEAERSLPFFSPQGDAVLYVVKLGGKSMLSYYHLETGKYSRMVTLPDEFTTWEHPTWTADEYVGLVGVNESRGTDDEAAARSARLFVVDLKRDKLIYASPLIEGFSTFVEFAETTDAAGSEE